MKNNMDNSNNVARELETAGITALSAASKTPFRTAFSITVGIGLARLALFAGFVAIVTVAVLVLRH
jgi:hypothetical protein